MITTRLIQENEINVLYDMILKLAHYLGDEIEMTPTQLHDSIFKDHLCNAVISFKDDMPVGMGFYYYTFSTMTGKKGIYLLDLFVDEKARHQGVGKSIFKALAKVALENDCKRIDWDCLKWNEGSIKMYESMSPQLRDDHHFFRLDFNQIQQLAK